MATETNMETVQRSPGITLMEGEEVLHVQTPRWRDYPWSVTIGILTCWFGVGLLPLAWVWYKRRKQRLVITNERIVQKQTSMFSSDTKEYPIRDINQLQTSGERFQLIGTKRGTVQFSVGGGGELVSLTNLREYESIANIIREQQRRIASR